MLRFADLGEVAAYCPDFDRGSSTMATAELRSFRTATRTCLPAVVALIVAGFGGAAAAPEPSSIVVRGDVQIGRFLVQRDGTLDGSDPRVRQANKLASRPVSGGAGANLDRRAR
jgi:hypothetical protein